MSFHELLNLHVLPVTVASKLGMGIACDTKSGGGPAQMNDTRSTPASVRKNLVLYDVIRICRGRDRFQDDKNLPTRAGAIGEGL